VATYIPGRYAQALSASYSKDASSFLILS
jgi:hypothetical protein